MESFTKNIADMSVSHDLIISTDTFKSYRNAGINESEAVTKCLYDLGMDTEEVSMNFGYVRCHGDNLLGFQGKIYVGKTRPSYRHKHIWYTIDMMAPETVPAGKTPINLQDLGADGYVDVRSLEELEEAQQHEKRNEGKRKVRTPKFTVEPVDKVIARNNK